MFLRDKLEDFGSMLAPPLRLQLFVFYNWNQLSYVLATITDRLDQMRLLRESRLALLRGRGPALVDIRKRADTLLTGIRHDSGQHHNSSVGSNSSVWRRTPRETGLNHSRHSVLATHPKGKRASTALSQYVSVLRQDQNFNE